MYYYRAGKLLTIIINLPVFFAYIFLLTQKLKLADQLKIPEFRVRSSEFGARRYATQRSYDFTHEIIGNASISQVMNYELRFIAVDNDRKSETTLAQHSFDTKSDRQVGFRDRFYIAVIALFLSVSLVMVLK